MSRTPSSPESEQLAWDFDVVDGSEQTPVEAEVPASAAAFAPGSAAWIGALQANDADAMRLSALDASALDVDDAAPTTSTMRRCPPTPPTMRACAA